MAKTAQNTRFCRKWQNETCEMRVIHTDEKNEVALRPAQPRQGQVSGPF